MAERREHARYAIWFPVQISPADADAGAALAVSKDASSGGISISSATPFEAGAKVKVTFLVPPDTGDERRAEGTIVRIEANPDDPHGLWPFRIGIAFDQAIPDLEEQLRTIAGGASLA